MSTAPVSSHSSGPSDATSWQHRNAAGRKQAKRANSFEEPELPATTGTTNLAVTTTAALTADAKPTCPTKTGNAALAPVPINRTVLPEPVLDGLFGSVQEGGRWTPEPNCVPRAHTAIIVPYRDRASHLPVMLHHMHRYLQHNRIAYRIFIVHQVQRQTFNRAKLMNVGFVYARGQANFSCYVFHDVDLLPVVAGVPYNCSASGPLHMVTAMDKFGWRLPYASYFGGVCAFTGAQYERCNGFSNRFWGYGNEDDDGGFRVGASGQQMQRVPSALGRYSMIRHNSDPGNAPVGNIITRRRVMQQSRQSWRRDGLNSLNYTLNRVVSHKLYTELRVDLLQPVVVQAEGQPKPKTQTQTQTQTPNLSQWSTVPHRVSDRFSSVELWYKQYE